MTMSDSELFRKFSIFVPKNLITTVGKFRIGTSFDKDDGVSYFVSTVINRKAGRYETIIKEIGMNSSICFTLSYDPIEAVMNHIGMIKMGLTTNRKVWVELNVAEFMPNKIKETLDQKNLNNNVLTFKEEYPTLLLSMSDINVQPTKNHIVPIVIGLIVIIVIIYFFK